MRRGAMLWIIYRLLAVPALLIFGVRAVASRLPRPPKKTRSGYDRVLDEFGDGLRRLNFDSSDWEDSCVDIPQKAVQLFAARNAYDEISTEGFDSYFLSLAGSSAPEARDGFASIDLLEVAQVIQSAMDKIGQPFPREQALRRKILFAEETTPDFDQEQNSFEKLLEIKSFNFGTSRILLAKANSYAETIW